MDPLIAATHALLAANTADLRRLVDGLDGAALNHVPAQGTNSIAVLVAHAVSSTRFLVDSAITGHMDRDHYLRAERVAAFATQDADAARLTELLDDLDATAARLAAADVADWSDLIADATTGRPSTRTRAWSLIHAVEHLREHIGHAELTRQLLEQGIGRAAHGA